MNFIRGKYTSLLLIVCFFAFSPHTAVATSWEKGGKTAFHFTVLNSLGKPQTGIILKITNRNEEYTSNEQGTITFETEVERIFTRTAKLYFPEDKEHEIASFLLDGKKTTHTFYINRPAEIASFKQQNRTFPIEGIVTDEAQAPISGAVVSIQGTGRKTLTDEIGLFHIEADYSHAITIRAERMDNVSLTIEPFLKNPEEPYPIKMQLKNSRRIYNVVEQMPEYPGGMKAFMNYLKRKLIYPEQAKKDSIEGVVVIQFVVEQDGSITQPFIARRLEASLDTAALQAILEMPRWRPGRDHGLTVRCKSSVPVQFKLPKPKPVLPKRDTLLVQKDSLTSDSLFQDKFMPDSLRADSLPTDSLSGKMPTDSLSVQSAEGDSLLNDSARLSALNDTIQTDTLKQSQTDAQQKALKPKRRNRFIRFFRRLFGIKDKEAPRQTTDKKELPLQATDKQVKQTEEP